MPSRDQQNLDSIAIPLMDRARQRLLNQENIVKKGKPEILSNITSGSVRQFNELGKSAETIVNVTSACSQASAVPELIAALKCAAANAGPSFKPSPITATCSPSACNLSTSASLSSGDCSAYQLIGPIASATLLTLCSRSPDTSWASSQP